METGTFDKAFTRARLVSWLHELAAPLLVALAALLLFFAAVRLYGADAARLVPDMRHLEPRVQGESQNESLRWFDRYRKELATGQQPFQVALQLASPLRAGDGFELVGEFEVGEGTVCMRTWISGSGGNAPAGMNLIISANDVSRKFPMKEIGDLRPITLEGISPEDEKVTVELSLVAAAALADVAEESTRVSVNYLYFWSCE